MPVDEVTVSVDEGTDKSVFIDRELGMSVPETTGGWPTSLTAEARPHEQASKTKPSTSESNFLLRTPANLR